MTNLKCIILFYMNVTLDFYPYFQTLFIYLFEKEQRQKKQGLIEQGLKENGLK